MNNPLGKNYLLIGGSESSSTSSFLSLYNVCKEYSKRGNKVLYLSFNANVVEDIVTTHSTVKEDADMNSLATEETLLKRIIFIRLLNHNRNIESALEKLMELHLWNIKPNMILLDSSGLHQLEDLSSSTGKHRACFLISSFIHLAENFTRKFQVKTNHVTDTKNIQDSNINNSSTECISLAFINSENLPNDLISLLQNLYYYKKFYTNVDQFLREVIPP